MTVPLQQREPKLAAGTLAMLFHERWVKVGEEMGLVAKPGPEWGDLSQEDRDRLVKVFEQLQGLFTGFGEAGRLQVTSIVSHRTHEGVVQFAFGEHGGQVNHDNARLIAYDFLDAAEAAETDSTIYRLLKGFESPENEVEAVRFIAALRNEREKVRVEKIERKLKNA